jgi:hypothetical protein
MRSASDVLGELVPVIRREAMRTGLKMLLLLFTLLSLV